MSTLGLPPRTAMALAYSGWWVTGAIVWLLERQDARVRFHAAQSMIVFGGAALLVLVLAGMAAVSLTFLPGMFGWLVSAAGLTWVAAVVLWIVVMWKVVRGDEWTVPAAAEWVNRLNRRPTSSAPASA